MVAARPSSSSIPSFNPSIPRNISPGSWRLIGLVMAHFDVTLKASYFRPVGPYLGKHRESMLLRLQSSNISRRTRFILYKAFETILKGEDWRYHTLFDEWAQWLEQEHSSIWRQSLTSQSHDQLGDALEVSYVKIRLLRGQNVYQHLQHAGPSFLHAIISDPSLCPTSHDPPSIPLARVLASSRCERWHFAFMDVVYAMAYGLPHIIRYDTSPDPTLDPNSYSTFVWSHGCLAEHLMVLADINTCRDTKCDWRGIERTLLEWQPRPVCSTGWESWMTVAWLAIQESWRHALFVYLYMAVYGVSSDDSRIQSSVKQLLQILKTVPLRDPDWERPVSNMHLFVGVCARTEKQRTIVRSVLADPAKTRLWLVGGADFVPVLEHLWLGAAAGGQPIKWEDYMHSRETVLPVLGV